MRDGEALVAAVLTGDERVVYFSQSTTGAESDYDIFRATRQTSAGPFDPPAPMAVLNAPV